jgi:acyl-CoA synthetase (NDP forming)
MFSAMRIVSAYARALDIAAKDPNSDGLLVILAPQGHGRSALVAESLKPYAKIMASPCSPVGWEETALPPAKRS